MSNINVVSEREDEARNEHNPEWYHKMYSSLLSALSNSTIYPRNCIDCVIGASSTNIYPPESVVHTLLNTDRYALGGSYWSSRGQSDPDVPETIQYKLLNNVCIVNEIQIRPCKASWEQISAPYSAQFVQFRMGHPRSVADFEVDVRTLPLQQLHDNYIWTFTSPEFPMAQEPSMQTFKLPEPTICVGGFLQIEFLGRTRKRELDGLYYLWQYVPHSSSRPLSMAGV
ncbi:hypothetical protein RD792_011839 [Penstemon davidsonii]|uniref:Uncharacterized protein n=1 Tax=Penstemon davidsonii TaxID=160366 RepID=A0ABR0CV84_9LAMI|nr:hypothetical protein RD792_011839 [Penstemon davidsonii]